EVKLPEQYTFRHDAAYEQLLETAAYLKSVYGDVMAYRSPKADITGGDYSSDKKPHFQLSFFDADGSEIDQILHYHFESTHFAPSDSGRLFLIRKFNTRTEKVADYPVFSVEEAKRLLHEKDFSGTVFNAFQKSDREQILKNIVHTELIYNTGIYDEYFLPIYRFYIEVPGSQEQGGIKGFGWYDIPAVHTKYLTEADEQSRD
ncbi:MAG: hypothetical protein Q4A41_04605, partial [Bacillota bacterium]|nr:hypothetical protein [Bacillota bacterium]